MKKYLAFAFMAVFIVGVFFILQNKIRLNSSQTRSTETTNQVSNILPTVQSGQGEQIDYQSFFAGEVNLCSFFPKEKIEELLGKTFVEIKPGVSKTSKYTEYCCEYYQEEAKLKYEGTRPIVPKRLPICLVKGKVQELKDAYKLFGYQVKQDSQIPFSHQLIYDQNDKFRTLEIFLTDEIGLFVNPFQSNLTQEEALNFVKKFVDYFKEFVKNKTNSSSSLSSVNLTPTDFSTSSNKSIPFPQDEEIIRNFVSQIEQGKADNAAKMIKTKTEEEMQAWGVQFSHMTSFKLLKMEKAKENEWTQTKRIYKVIFEVQMDPRSANAPIPYYGWENGQNIRWITLEKVGEIWKITEIATGS